MRWRASRTSPYRPCMASVILATARCDNIKAFSVRLRGVSMAQPSVHGRFIWQEMMTDDTAGAAEFYTKVVGWHVRSAGQAHGDYQVFVAGKQDVGGVMSLPQHARDAGARPHWLPYIGADDVDGAVSRIEQLGGK